MKLTLLALAVLGLASLASCASHNSHHITVDLTNDFDPLVDEAYGKLMQSWPPGEPGGNLGTLVWVEPVVIHWSPLVVEPGQAVPIYDQNAMGQRIEERLWQLMGGAPDPLTRPDFVVEAELEADLHDPGSILFGVTCMLARADRLDAPLARGSSHLVQLPRLYCHGCNEAMGGHGSNLGGPGPDGGYYGFSAGVGVGFWGGSCPSPSGGGYSKH
jgi:hypothetical protein